MADLADPAVSIPLATVAGFALRELWARYAKAREKLEERVEGGLTNHLIRLDAGDKEQHSLDVRLAKLEVWRDCVEKYVLPELSEKGP